MVQHEAYFVLILYTPHPSLFYTASIHFNMAATYYDTSV